MVSAKSMVESDGGGGAARKNRIDGTGKQLSMLKKRGEGIHHHNTRTAIQLIYIILFKHFLFIICKTKRIGIY